MAARAAVTTVHVSMALQAASGSSSSFSIPERSLTRISPRSEEHTSELQSRQYLVCRLLLEKQKERVLATAQVLRQAGYPVAPGVVRGAACRRVRARAGLSPTGRAQTR